MSLIGVFIIYCKSLLLDSVVLLFSKVALMAPWVIFLKYSSVHHCLKLLSGHALPVGQGMASRWPSNPAYLISCSPHTQVCLLSLCTRMCTKLSMAHCYLINKSLLVVSPLPSLPCSLPQTNTKQFSDTSRASKNSSVLTLSAPTSDARCHLRLLPILLTGYKSEVPLTPSWVPLICWRSSWSPEKRFTY